MLFFPTAQLSTTHGCSAQWLTHTPFSHGSIEQNQIFWSVHALGLGTNLYESNTDTTPSFQRDPTQRSGFSGVGS